VTATLTTIPAPLYRASNAIAAASRAMSALQGLGELTGTGAQWDAQLDLEIAVDELRELVHQLHRAMEACPHRGPAEDWTGRLNVERIRYLASVEDHAVPPLNPRQADAVVRLFCGL
jgi:hypothetical protein